LEGRFRLGSVADVVDRALRYPDSVRYRELAPPPPLAPYVECFWEVEASDESHRVLPDGCMDILFHVGDSRARVIGPMTGPALVEAEGISRTTGVRFRPGVAPGLLGFAASELRDAEASAVEALGPEGRTLDQRLADADGDLGVVRQALCDVVKARLRAAPRGPRAVGRAIALFESSGGTLAVYEVAACLGVGERQLERLFHRWVGYGPKMFARVVRTRRATRAIARGTIASWASLAADCGYVDQAHLVREFRALTGVTPRLYARGVSEIDNTGGGPAGSVVA
jgi:AraC-like DNA-binding protein